MKCYVFQKSYNYQLCRPIAVFLTINLYVVSSSNVFSILVSMFRYNILMFLFIYFCERKRGTRNLTSSIK